MLRFRRILPDSPIDAHAGIEIPSGPIEKIPAPPSDGQFDLSEGRRLERLRRRLDRAALEIGDLTEEAVAANLPATADALGRACRLLFLVAGPPDGEPPVREGGRGRPATHHRSPNINCPECDHQVERVPGLSEYDCPQCGCRFYDEEEEEEKPT